MRRRLSARGAGVVLGLVLSSAPALSANFTFNSVSDDEIDWADPANWTPNSIPTLTDDATVVSGLLRGAEVHDDRGVNSLVLDSGLNVYRGGSLTVTNGISANAGYFINDGTVFANVTNKTYISNTQLFVGNLDNSDSAGAVLNENLIDGSSQWIGDVTSNAGWILNSHGTWKGDLLGNTGIVDNRNGATWTGSVVMNDGEIDSIRSTWIGDVTNRGLMVMSGTLVGSIGNSGSIAVIDPLKGVKSIVNVGNIGLDDGAADDTLSAVSLFDQGTERFDFDPAAGKSDRIILSSYYAGTPTLIFNIVGANGRALVDVPVIEAGVSSATPTVEGLPGDGIISYRLERQGTDWVIAASLNDAPAQVASALGAAEASLSAATRVGLGSAEACGRGGWARGLGDNADIAGNDIGLSGVQLGYDLACLAVPHSGATLGIGITMGMAGGDIGGPVSGDLQQQFGGLYADLVGGAFRAILEGQAGRSRYRLSDPGALLDKATLEGTSLGLSGSASYALALGGVTLLPEAGFAASSSGAGSTDFGDVGSMSLSSSPSLAAHVGATLSADLALDDGLLLTPFASAILHGDVVTPAVTFTDGVGNTAPLPDGGIGPYVALALGADLVHAGTLQAGLRTDLKLGPNITDTSVSGHAKVSF